MPLAVAYMAVDASALARSDRKGKAAVVLHMHKDCLWEMGKGGEPPELPAEEQEAVVHDEDAEDDAPGSGVATPPPASEADDEEPPKNLGGDHVEEEKDEDAGPSLKPEGERFPFISPKRP